MAHSLTYKRVVAGMLCLIVLGLIVGAVRPYKHALGSQQLASPVVEVVQVQQEDVPIIHEWIGTLDGLVNATSGPRLPGT